MMEKKKKVTTMRPFDTRLGGLGHLLENRSQTRSARWCCTRILCQARPVIPYAHDRDAAETGSDCPFRFWETF